MSMKLSMSLGKRSYDIIIKRGTLGRAGQLCDLTHRKVFILTDSGVPEAFAQTILDQCADGTIYTVPQGEGSKSLAVYEKVARAMLAFGCDRTSLVAGVGGGMIGDLAGFCAATYMRGIDFINCPTTSLSQFDSSIGGKVAVDLGDTKNILGAFWQPKLVLIDPDTLATLPRRQFVNGLAESIKMSLFGDEELFEMYEEGREEEEIEEIIYRSLCIKKKIVEEDETEKGNRAVLNLGHTLGHGIEAVKGIRGRRTRGLYHGECVALGLLPMVEDPALVKRIKAVYRRLGLPTRTGYDKAKVYEAMTHDKKSRGGTVRLVKVPRLGTFRIVTVPRQELKNLAEGLPLTPVLACGEEEPLL